MSRKLKADHGITPGLAVVLVGEDPASQVYVRNKGKQTVEAGMHSVEHRMDASVSEAELIADGRAAERRPGDPRDPGAACRCRTT